MFGVDLSEFMVIGVVALIVIGPEKLPRVARTAGLLLGRLQRHVSEVKADISREIQLEEMKRLQSEVLESARELEQSVQSQVRDVEQSVQSQVRDVEQGVQAQVREVEEQIQAQPVSAVEDAVAANTASQALRESLAPSLTKMAAIPSPDGVVAETAEKAASNDQLDPFAHVSATRKS